MIERHISNHGNFRNNNIRRIQAAAHTYFHYGVFHARRLKRKKRTCGQQLEFRCHFTACRDIFLCDFAHLT